MIRLFYRFIPIFFLLVTLTGCDSSSTESGIQSNNAILESSSDDKVCNIESNDEDNTSEHNRLSEDKKLEDFEFLFSTLESNYPYFQMNIRQHEVDWIANKEDYVKRIKETEGDLEFYIVLNSIMKDLNDDHARVLDNRLYASALSTYKNVMLEPWLEILEDPVVQNRYWNVEGYKKNETDTYVNSNNFILEKWIESSTAYIRINSFNHFNIEDDWKTIQPFLNDLDDIHSLIIDIRGNSGGDTTYWTQYLVPELVSEPKEFSQYYCFRGGEYSENFIDFALGYKYSEMEIIDEAFIEELSYSIPVEIKTDFRYYVENTLVIHQVDNEGYSGDIYILVDSNVNSSSESFVQFVRDTELAYIIGEPTSGESSGFDSLLLRLPNSGYVIQFPGVMVLSSNGVSTKENIINPDLLVDSKTALEVTMELIKIVNGD